MIEAFKKRYPATVFWFTWASWSNCLMAIVEQGSPYQVMNDPWVIILADVNFTREEGQSQISKPQLDKDKLKVGFIDSMR